MKQIKSPGPIFWPRLVAACLVSFSVCMFSKRQKGSEPDWFFFAYLLVVLLVAGIFVITRDRKNKADLKSGLHRPWKCPKCGVVSEPQFDSCWKCGTLRKDA